MTAEEIAEKAHSMNLQEYKTARLTVYSQSREELHEIILTYINTLSYNAAWDFHTFDSIEGSEYKTVLTFKYNGTILVLNALQKLHFGYVYRQELKWR